MKIDALDVVFNLPEIIEMRSILARQLARGWWDWEDMTRMEKILPTATEQCAAAYGLSATEFELVLSNGSGMYLLPEVREDIQSILDSLTL